MRRRDDPLIHSHPAYLVPSSTDDERHRAYRAMAMETLFGDHLNAITIRAISP